MNLIDKNYIETSKLMSPIFLKTPILLIDNYGFQPLKW